MSLESKPSAFQPCAVQYSTPGTCGWCGWAKGDHAQLRSLVYRCSHCGERYHDPSWDDINAHWEQHIKRRAWQLR